MVNVSFLSSLSPSCASLSLAKSASAFLLLSGSRCLSGWYSRVRRLYAAEICKGGDRASHTHKKKTPLLFLRHTRSISAHLLVRGVPRHVEEVVVLVVRVLGEVACNENKQQQKQKKKYRVLRKEFIFPCGLPHRAPPSCPCCSSRRRAPPPPPPPSRRRSRRRRRTRQT